MKSFIVAIALLAFAWSGVLVGQEYNPGRSWSDFTFEKRLFWVWGASKGQELIFEELKIENDNSYENAISMDDAESVSRIMTDLYNDPANTFIPWKYMMITAKLKLQGAPATRINERLELLRNYAAYERSKK
jgi:hypothetical protein